MRLDQPYRNYAVDLLLPQHYPPDKGAPYDDVSWELPANYHLTVVTDGGSGGAHGQSHPVEVQPPRPSGAVTGSGKVYLLKDTGQESLLEARYRLAGFAVSIAERPFALQVASRTRPAPGSLPSNVGWPRRCGPRPRSWRWTSRP